ncbi:MAG: hypothetical protein KGJ78_11690 [Alphaproteobacteria bacterium]|nr:hypothetical protein [Alphaproteobacteria bacterium]
MRRSIFAGLACIALFSAALAEDGANDYTFTWVRQYNGHTLVVRQKIDAQRYLQLRDQMMSVSRFAAEGGPPPYRGNDTVTLDQRGRGHFATAAQYGSGDNAAIRQSGAANVMYLNQAGSDLNASSAQSGDHNITLVDQWNGAPAPVVWGPPRPYRDRRAALRNLE